MFLKYVVKGGEFHFLVALCGYGENTYISNFVSGGPKFYAYTAVTPNKDDKIECCKINDAFANDDHKSEKMNDECSKIRLNSKLSEELKCMRL
ncbi:hypothetical protein TSAR_011108 [Trichomalopsis sarcophagae]|uniref:Uncharacterized protein n=1 Tax=Trichomalopsis sarcophagae TaxID=543379 RepID=A0A232EGB6_9HYME|nr:hypothetical protein TSAR_011108 [Trichomalopsis sarcophagae]